MNWDKIWNSIKDYFTNSGLNIVKGLAILLFGILIANLFARLFRLVFGKIKMEKTLQTFLASTIRFVLNLVVIVIALQTFGVNSTSMIALLSAAGLAVSLALQGSLSNLANGIVIVLTKPFKEGDFVSINGVEGSVQNIRMLTTAIATPDNKLIIIPNSTIVTNEVINFSARRFRRVSFSFNVAYETDVDKVKQIVLEVMNSCEKIREKDPKPPFVALKSLGERSIEIYANCWCLSADYWDVHYYVVDKVFNEFKKFNINIPFNQLEVRLRNDDVVMPYRTEALPERAEKKEIIAKKSLFTKFIDYNKEHSIFGSNKNKKTSIQKTTEKPVVQTKNIVIEKNSVVEKKNNLDDKINFIEKINKEIEDTSENDNIDDSDQK